VRLGKGRDEQRSWFEKRRREGPTGRKLLTLSGEKESLLQQSGATERKGRGCLYHSPSILLIGREEVRREKNPLSLFCQKKEGTRDMTLRKNPSLYLLSFRGGKGGSPSIAEEELKI